MSEATPPQPGFWSSLWNSATSFQFYRDIKDQPFKASLRYVVLLAAFLSVFISARLLHDVSGAMQEWVAWISTTIPDIKIEKGVASLSSGQPKSVSDDRAILILDPYGPKQEIPKEFRTGMVLGKDQFFVKWNQVGGPVGEPSRLEQFIYFIAYLAYVVQPQDFRDNVFSLANVQSLTIDTPNVQRWKVIAKRCMGFVLPFVYFIFYLVGKLSQALFFSVVLSYATRSAQGDRLAYAGILNLSLYALTPPMLFGALLQIAGIKVPTMDWIFMGMYIAFLMGAVNSCFRNKTSEASGQDAEEETEN